MRPEPINFLDQQTERVKPKNYRLIFFIVFLLLILGGCTARAIIDVSLPNDPEAYDPVTLEPKKPKGLFGKLKSFVFSKDVPLEGEKKDRINILLLGQGGLGHDGPFLSDTIILISVKPSTNQIAFISIPRDLQVSIPGHGDRKINHANAFGEASAQNSGPALASKVIAETFGQEINYYIRVDFKAFEELIDTIGGVRVNVEQSFVDSQYPAPNFQYQTIVFNKGIQTMDGNTALKFVRSRHGTNGEGSDFARSKRQQKVILAVKEKLLSFQTLSNPVKLNNILESLDEHVTTNLEFADIIALAKLGKELDTDNIISLTLDSGVDGYLKNGVSPIGEFILTPVSGNFDAINLAVEHIFDTPPDIKQDDTPTQDKPAITYTGANIEIQNGTWTAGMASRVKKKLVDQTFAVTAVGNTQTRPVSTSAIYVLTESENSEIVQALQSTLGMPIEKNLPQGEIATSTTDILIILGEDYSE